MENSKLYALIRHSKTSDDASDVHEKVKDQLNHYVGSLGVSWNLGDNAHTRAVNLVKKFLSTIADRLKKTPEIDLYETHILCQKYLKQLCSPEDPDYLKSRCDLMYVYEYLKNFEEAQREGLEVLNEIHMLFAGPRSRIPQGQVLPTYHPDMEPHTAVIVIKVSMVLLNASWSYIKEDDNLDDLEELENIDIYDSVLSLAKEMEEWIRLFSSESLYTNLTKWLATFLGVRTLPLIEIRSESMVLLITGYCTMTLSNFAKASMDDAMCNFGRDICHSVFSNSNVNLSDASDIATSVLDCIAERCRECPVIVVEFLKLAVYCTVNHGPATAEQCDNLALFFRTTADMFSDMDPPPEVETIPVHLFLNHLAIALVINDLDAYKRWGDTRFSPRRDSQVFDELEDNLEKWTRFIYKRYPELDIFFYDRLSTLILSNEIDPIKLPTIPYVLDRFIDDFFTYCRLERNEFIDNKHIEVAAKVGAAYFMFLLIKKEETKRNHVSIKLMKENRSKPKLLEYLTQILEGVAKAFDNNGRMNEVIESSKLCCMIQWERVSGFCEMLESTEYGVSSGFSEYAIVDLVTKASHASASLLLLFNKHRRAELNIMLIQLVERWLDARKNFDIPSPVALVHQWVDIQYEQPQGDNRNVSTIYSLVHSLKTSNQSGGIILEQELHEYQENRDRNRQLCEKMEMLIDTILKTNGRIGLSRSDSLIKCGARLASCGTISCQSDSIKYIDEAISILVNLENTNKKVPLLIKAYCSKALFTRIVHPSLKEFTEDIENALKAWDLQSASHDKIKLPDTDINLLFHVADLLALEGNGELHFKLYKMMIKRMKLAGNRELSDFLEMAWKSGSLNHAICTSPVDALIVEEIENDNVQFWINCGKTQEQKAGIKQCLSVFPTLSSVDLHDDAHAKEAQKTINEVKEAISTLINEGSDSFSAARLHYDLAERFIAKGLFIEALSHATESYLLREKHLSKCFDIKWHQGEANIVGRGDTKITKCDCTRFNMNPSSVSPFAQTYPTPWSTVKCYLESSLQTGTVQEMIGNGDEAEKLFLRGHEIATLLNLPMFIGGFSTALGKIYQKKQLWTLALKYLQYAQELDCSSISCQKCRLVSEVTRGLQLGDFHLSRSQSDFKENDDMKKAQELYIEARRKLNDDVWNNIKCLPDISKTPDFCSALGVLGACGSEEDCWHCGPSISEKSLFLNTSIDMKWECIRRRHMVRLLTRLGKCCKLQGKIKEEYTYLLESICILVCRNTFWKQSVSSTFVEKLLSKGVMGDAYGVEHASVVYKMCCFSLIHKNSGEEVDKLSTESVISGLKLAFILSREVRKLHEKVSRLLSVMYACLKDNSTPEHVSMSQWASYFHQSSVGSYFNSCILSQNRNLNDDLREVLSPHSLTVLETSVSKFFDMLPSVSILCISMLDGHSEKFLKHLLPDSPNSAWIMVSKMSLNRRPILIILPICEVFEGHLIKENPSLVGNWRCPWAHNVFDKLAPRLRRILEEDNKIFDSESLEKRLIKDRRLLDKHLEDLLRDMENQWFGPWIHLLLGEWSHNQDLDATVEEIMSYLTKDELDALVDRRFLKAVIEGVQNNFQEEEVMAKLKLNNGFFIGKSTSVDGTSTPHLHGILLKHIKTVLGNKNEKLCRNPVILVLDNDIQMLPIENMPLLTKQEIYRMPSVGGIIWTIFDRERSREDKMVVDPQHQMVIDLQHQMVIDPRDCYYLIYTNFKDTISCFDNWSKTYNFKGCCMDWSKSRDMQETLGVDKLSELREELKTRNLFIYMGHGDGRKLIQAEEIGKIDSCGAVFLIGCSTGYINYGKSRVPDGAPLDYLLASSAAIVANLWIVTTGCMNLLTTELLQAWLDTISAKSVDCNQAVHEKLEHNENPNKRKAEVEDNGSTSLCIHKRNLGSSLIKAREIVRRNQSYKDLVATVVYGIPIHITGNNQNT